MVVAAGLILFFQFIHNNLLQSASSKKIRTPNRFIMSIPWYYLLAYILFGVLLLWIFDKRQIIKPKTLRYFTVIFVYTLLCWGIYDLVLT